MSIQEQFDVTRHNDRSYSPLTPWSCWDDDANCWVCLHCGAGAGYQLHNPGCKETTP